MDNKTVEERTIFLGIVGSTAYGTNTITSDEDIAGICIPTLDYYIGSKKFDQADKWLDESGEKIDKTIFSIDKALELITDNNPNCLDMLFLPERCVKICKPEWKKIVDIRDKFISKKCKHTFSGYAFAQLEKINTHRSYLLYPVKKPDRKQYGLKDKSIFPDTQIEVISKLGIDYISFNDKDSFYKEMNQIVSNDMMTVFRKYLDPELVPLVMQEFIKGQKTYLRTFESISSTFLKEEYVDAAKNEMRYLTSYKNWKRYEEWKKNRNPKRQALEEKCGFDSKHASHLIRLERMGIEILEGKGVLVDRTNIDAEELLSIRMGNYKFETILEMSRKNQDKMDELYTTSKIPNQPDRNLIEQKKMEILEKYLFGKGNIWQRLSRLF